MRNAQPLAYPTFLAAISAIAPSASFTVSVMPASDTPHYLPPFSATDAGRVDGVVASGGYTIAYTVDSGDANLGAILELYDEDHTLVAVWGSPA